MELWLAATALGSENTQISGADRCANCPDPPTAVAASQPLRAQGTILHTALAVLRKWQKNSTGIEEDCPSPWRTFPAYGGTA